MNTHKSNQSGEHWLAFYYNEDGICTFFDSFGLEPYVYGLQEYLNKTSVKWIYNDTQLQSFTSKACGYYCIYFILCLSRGLGLEDSLSLFDKENFHMNDTKVINVY